VNHEDDMRRLLEWGVDGLITDRPDLAVPVVQAWPRG
jgi:glycerophosphoryl diester phosphodiesterase